MTYLAGYIRVETNGFIGVHILFASVASLTLLASMAYVQKKNLDVMNLQVKQEKDNGYETVALREKHLGVIKV